MIYLIGAGPMALEYAKVLKANDFDYICIGRSERSARNFELETGKKVFTGGIDQFVQENGVHPTKNDQAIVAVSVEMLYKTSMSLLNYGFRKILIEKPAGLSIEEINDLALLSEKCSADVFVAYNRRFYSSVLKAKELIKADGGVSSFNFEFTEWSHQIENLKKDPRVLQKWFLSNSSHIADLAFFLGGKPKEFVAFTNGNLSWHSDSSNFCGAGISIAGALFNYQANWEAPGRWGVEILTINHRLYLRPLEKLQVQKKGEMAIRLLELDDHLEKEFKPGLFCQTEAFLKMNYENLCSIKDQLELIPIYYKIANYK